MNSPPDIITTATPREPDPDVTGSAGREATVLQVLPDLWYLPVAAQYLDFQ